MSTLGIILNQVHACMPSRQIKTRVQHCRTAPPVQGLYVYRNSWDCLQHVVKHQGGVRSLYRGFAPVLLAVTPEKFTKIFVNDHLRCEPPSGP